MESFLRFCGAVVGGGPSRTALPPERDLPRRLEGIQHCPTIVGAASALGGYGLHNGGFLWDLEWVVVGGAATLAMQKNSCHNIHVFKTPFFAFFAKSTKNLKICIFLHGF